MKSKIFHGKLMTGKAFLFEEYEHPKEVCNEIEDYPIAL